MPLYLLYGAFKLNPLLERCSLRIKAIPLVILHCGFLTLPTTHAGWWRVEQLSDLDASFKTVNLNANQNVAGSNFPTTANTNINGQKYTTKCDQGTFLSGFAVNVHTTGEYINPVVLTESGRNYVEVNEYLLAAVQYGYGKNLYWLPMNNAVIGTSTDQCNSTSTHIGDTPINIQLKIKKQFVGPTSFKLPIARIYTGDSIGSAKSRGAAQNIYLSGTVVVPQSCKVNAGQKLDINFGDISANDFNAIGIGNKPISVNVQTRSFDVECTNIAAQALLTLRVESENSNGEMILSDNPDIGFKIADQNNRVLSPNNFNSSIPFTNQNPTNITLKAWPVSTTNKLPAVGPFRARGYLRVDFS